VQQTTLADWVLVIGRRWRLIAIVTLATMVSAVLAGLWLAPRVYVGEVSLRTPGEQPRLGALAPYLATGLGGGLGLAPTTAVPYVRILESYELARRVEGRLDLRQLFEERTHLRAAKALQEAASAQEQDAVIYIRVHVRGTVRGFSRVPTDVDDQGRALGADAGVREMAALIANTYAEELQRYLQEESVTTAGRTLAFVREELAKAHAEFEEAGRRLQAFQEEHGTIGLTEQTRALVDVASQLGRDEQIAQAQLAEATSALTTARERQAALGEAPGLALPPGSPRLDTLYAEYVTKQTELALKRQEMTERHGEVQALKAELAEVAQRIEEEKERIRLGASRELDPRLVEMAVTKAGAAARARSLSAAVAALRSQLRPLPALARRLAELELDVQTKRALVEVLTKEEAQVAIQERREGNWVQVLDRALPPDRPVSPRLKLIVALAFVVGLMLSTTWAFVTEGLKAATGPQVVLGDDDRQDSATH
jgi:succinoglycan biosynthesis transport protein ExoP